MALRILCFGDSNTYGYDPKGGRYDENTRWPMALQNRLGTGFRIIEEGFNGRTCVFDDPVEGGYKSGLNYLPPCLMSHNPLDAVVLMLGSNDSKARFGMSAMTIGEGMMQLIRCVRLYGMNAHGQPPRILLIAPSPIRNEIRGSRYWECFGPNAQKVTHDLADEYRRISRLLRCEFLDAAPVAEVSPIDALHLTAKGHLALTSAVADKLTEMFSQEMHL